MNKGELKAAVLDTLVRQDLSGKPIVDMWVQTATNRLNEDLLLNDQLVVATMPVTGKNVNLPSDFIAAKSVRILGADTSAVGRSLEYLPPEELEALAHSSPNRGRQFPTNYATYGKRMELLPFIGANTTGLTLEMWYYREFPQLDTDDNTNFILTRYPQLYLNLTCAAGHQYLLEVDAAAGREALAMAEIQRLMARREYEKYGEGPLIIGPPRRRLGGRHS